MHGKHKKKHKKPWKNESKSAEERRRKKELNKIAKRMDSDKRNPK